MHQVHLVGMTKGDVLRAERGRFTKLAVGYKSAQPSEIDGGVRSGFFMRDSAHQRYSLSHFWRVVKTDRLANKARSRGVRETDLASRKRAPLKPISYERAG
jgi:hypothetical protein